MQKGSRPSIMLLRTKAEQVDAQNKHDGFGIALDKNCLYSECSSLTGEGVVLSFLDLVD